ncbi:MAG: hypothetical protein EGR78_09850 [Erysipelotrichaceae bacterium]|nr:hypothetical protein [Erysipelotrichaceae bacterium]
MSALKRRADYGVSLVRRLLGHASQPAERTSVLHRLLPDATGKTIPCGEYPHGSVGVFVYMVAG